MMIPRNCQIDGLFPFQTLRPRGALFILLLRSLPIMTLLVMLNEMLECFDLLTFSSLVINLDGSKLTFSFSRKILLKLLLLLIIPYFSEDKGMHVSSLALSTFEFLLVPSQILLQGIFVDRCIQYFSAETIFFHRVRKSDPYCFTFRGGLLGFAERRCTF